MPLASLAPSVETILEPIHEGDLPVASQAPAERRPAQRTFDSVYQTHASFVFRNACRLGVPRWAVEDVMQEVFLVVHRRLPEFEERTSIRAWLSAIVIRVVRAHRRLRRKDSTHDAAASSVDPDSLADANAESPLDLAERDEAVRELYAVLSRMNEERREVLVLSELEQLTATEIAHALQVNVNTVYWRLRTARKEFERILFRRRAAGARSSR